MRTTSFSLLAILCLALTASAQIYSEGPIDGNDWAFFVTGPNLPNFQGYFQDISNGFVATNSGFPYSLEWAEWSLGAPTSFSWELGSSAFGADLGSGTVAQNAGNTTLLFTNDFGYYVYNVHVGISTGFMSAGNTYWLSISNANDAGYDGGEAWDVPNGGLGGPAICDFRDNGGVFVAGVRGNCGLGGESFTLSCLCCGVHGPDCGPSIPEPSSILLFGSGILGIAGILRRKLNR
jgi:hypothetical protein